MNTITSNEEQKATIIKTEIIVNREKFFPKRTTPFDEVLDNTMKIMGAGDGYNARYIKTFLNEVREVSMKYGCISIPDTVEILVELLAEKQNNIMKAEKFGRKTVIVPAHFQVKIKPSLVFRERALIKDARSGFLPIPKVVKERISKNVSDNFKGKRQRVVKLEKRYNMGGHSYTNELRDYDED